MKALALSAALFLALAGPAAAKTIKVEDGYFAPANTSIKRGQQVTWAWTGSDGHSVYFDNLSWKSPVAGKGYKWKKTFKKKGTFTFYCPQHPGMQGKVKVK